MKLLILSQHFFPENFIINSFCKELLDKGINLEIFTGKPNYPYGEIFKGFQSRGIIKKKYHGAKINYLPLIPRKKGSILNLFINYISFLISCIIHLNFYVKKNDFDYIFVYQTSPISIIIPAILLKLRFRIPVIVWVQDLWPDNIYSTRKIKKNIILDFILSYICKKIYKSSDLLLIQSKNFKKKFLNYQIEKKKIIYFPNFYETNFKLKLPDKIKKIIDRLKKSKFPIIFAGNIGVLQSLYTIIDASFFIKKDIDIFIIGSGSEKEKLIKYKYQKKVSNIHFIDFVNPKYIDQVLSNAKGLLISYLNDQQLNLTVPSKFQAYLSLGIPIIGSISGTTSELIKKNKLGYVSDPEDHKTLAKNINKLCSLKSIQFNHISENCKNFFKNNYSKNILIDKFFKIISSYNKL